MEEDMERELLDRFEKLEDKLTKVIQETVKSLQDHTDKLLELTIDPIKESVNRHTKDIDELYNKDRENRDRFGKIEGRVNILEDDKIDNKDNGNKWVAIIGILGGLIVGLIGFLL